MAHVYKAVSSRDELIGQRLRTLANNLCGGSSTPLLTHLLQTERLTRAELDELRALLEEMGERKRGKGPSGHKRN